LAPSTATRVGKISNRFWLSGILCSIVHGLLKAGRLANEANKLQGSQAWSDKGSSVDAEAKLQTLSVLRASTRHQFIIDILDVWIPASGLGLVNINDGLLGIIGLITSLMGLRQQWNAVNYGKK